MLERAESTPLRTPSTATSSRSNCSRRAGRSSALTVLTEATLRDPQDFWCWFLLGVCHDNLGQPAEAVACYSTCLAISPDSPWASFNRGLAAPPPGPPRPGRRRLRPHHHRAADDGRGLRQPRPGALGPEGT